MAQPAVSTTREVEYIYILLTIERAKIRDIKTKDNRGLIFDSNNMLLWLAPFFQDGYLINPGAIYI